ncbi:MAG TPA: transporter [Burkholderiales bacterium]|nr:transporter [Burkholderiales bacterium]
MLCLLLAHPALALHPLITEDAFTVGAGTSQLEIGFEHIRIDDDGPELRINLLRPVYSYGALDNLDLIVGLPMAQVREDVGGAFEHRHGIGDATLEVKWRFHEDQAVKFALKPGVSFATGDVERGFGGGRFAAGAALVATFEREGWNANLHGGYLWNDNKAGNRRDLWHLSGSLVFRARERLQFALDASVDSPLDPAQGSWPAVLLGAVIYSPHEDLDLDLGAKLGLNRLSDDYSVLAGVTFRW